MRTTEQQQFIQRLHGVAEELRARDIMVLRRQAIGAELLKDIAEMGYQYPRLDAIRNLARRLSRQPNTTWKTRLKYAAKIEALAVSFEQLWPQEVRMELLRPVEGVEINPDNPFGANPELYAPLGYSGHMGVDFSCPVGTPVRAAAAGYVVSCGPHGSAGNIVRLRHDGLIEPMFGGDTRYCHLSEWMVGPSDDVERGHVIGLSGNTGFSEGPHVHFDLWLDTEPPDNGYGGRVDPAPYLVDA